MQTRKLTLVVLGLLVGCAALALVPAASAQAGGMQVSMTITPSGEAVKPLRGSIQYNGQTTVTGTNDAALGNLVGIQLAYTVSKQPAWASITVSPATDILAVPQAPGASFTQSRSFTITISATQDAPAFTPDTIEISVTARPTQQGANPQTAKQSAPLQADFFSILDLVLQETIKVERPQTAVTFPLKVTNFGNGQTKINFDIDEGTTPNLNVPIPGAIQLGAKQQGSNQVSQEVPLQVQTPYKNGYLNEVGIVNFKVSSNYALDAKTAGDSGKVAVVVTTKGFYVPGFEPLFALALIGVAALVLRRRT